MVQTLQQFVGIAGVTSVRIVLVPVEMTLPFKIILFLNSLCTFLSNYIFLLRKNNLYIEHLKLSNYILPSYMNPNRLV